MTASHRCDWGCQWLQMRGPFEMEPISDQARLWRSGDGRVRSARREAIAHPHLHHIDLTPEMGSGLRLSNSGISHSGKPTVRQRRDMKGCCVLRAQQTAEQADIAPPRVAPPARPAPPRPAPRPAPRTLPAVRCLLYAARCTLHAVPRRPPCCSAGCPRVCSICDGRRMSMRRHRTMESRSFT